LKEKNMSENLQLQVSKIVRASRKQAFDAWTKPELLMQWFGPGQMLPSETSVDARPDGALRFVIQGPSPRTGQEMTIIFTGTFREVVADERLVFDWVVANDPGPATLVTVEFKDAEAGTEVVLTHEKIPNADLLNRNRFGWGGMLDKLAALYAEAGATSIDESDRLLKHG
jgi:uncharacterized protein YndB with AHSA1/START domain